VSATTTALALCNREREAQRWAAPRSAGPRRTAHMPTDTLRATALRRKEDDEMQRMDQLEQVWFSATISPPLRVAPTTARPCLALPSGPFDGCACSSGVHTPRCAQEQENAEFEASAKGRGLFGSTLFADDEDDGRGRSIQIVDSHKSCACALRSNALHCTALHCTALHCRGQSNAFSSNRCDWIVNRFGVNFCRSVVAFDLCAAMHSTLHCTFNIGDSVLRLSVGFALAPLWQS
jgi:hypothetical protein